MYEQKRLLHNIGKVWEKFPDLRLCQLMSNCFDFNDLYYVTDEELETKLLDFMLKHGSF